MNPTSPQRRLLEDFHGGEIETKGQDPTTSLERSQSCEGPKDLYIHPKSGQAGKPKSNKKGKKKCT